MTTRRSSVNKEEMNKSLSAEPPEVRCVYHQQTVALRWLREDFAGDLAVGLRRLIRGDMYVRLVGAAVQSKAAFLTSIEEPTCCYRLSRGETPDASQVWVEITPPIAFPILNCLLGGASDDAFLPRRPLTNIERRLLTRVVELIGASLSLAWPGQDKPSFVAEPLTTEATAGARDEQALAVSFEFGVDRQGGTGIFSDKNNSTTRVSELSMGENNVLWTVTNGVCPESIDTVMITINDLILQTLITPNLDGNNDFFVIKGIDGMGKTSFMVFNRWGARVFKNDDYDNLWDGVDDNGNPLPDDTYFYILKSENIKTIKGFFVIKQ